MANEIDSFYHEANLLPAVAVIVAYLPNPTQLQQLITRIVNEHIPVVVCDNGGAEWVSEWVEENLPLPGNQAVPVVRLPMGGNQGVGAALNRGFRWALAQRISYVATFDQDSLPFAGTLPHLIKMLATAPPQTAAVAPMIRDRRSDRLGPLVGEITSRGRRPKRYLLPGESAWLDHAITSGMVVKLSAWTAIGPFREDFFIDYIDIEWCLRARQKGYRILGTGDAELLHDLGERWIFLPWGTRVAVHRPERAYFEMRNGIITHRLAKERWWRWWHWWIGLRKAAFYLLFLPDRLARLRAMIRGIKDAFTCDGWRKS